MPNTDNIAKTKTKTGNFKRKTFMKLFKINQKIKQNHHEKDNNTLPIQEKLLKKNQVNIK